MKELNVGDKVFWATYNCIKVGKTCPVCFGKKVITVILGNEEKVEVDCNYCKNGYSESRGFTEVYEYKSDVKEIIIDGKEIKEGIDGRKIEYRYGCYCLNETNIFLTKEEAEKRVLELIEERENEEIERDKYIKTSEVKSVGWTIGYYQRKAKESKEEYERCLSRVRKLKTNNL